MQIICYNAKSTSLRQLKVLLKLFQKLAVSKGGAFGGFKGEALNIFALNGGLCPPLFTNVATKKKF